MLLAQVSQVERSLY